MPSTYTQNLGIERPANGEQANTWGITVNRNMDTLDMAINGNVQMALSSSPLDLKIDNGAAFPVAANPVIIWTGPQSGQGTVRIDWQSDRQHLYIMSNQTTGGYAIAFAQGTGNQFVLQPLHDAIIYADGTGASANVAAALANPQFNNMLLTGSLTLNGSFNGVLSFSGSTTILAGALGVENPAAVPEPITVTGIGFNGQIRMSYGNYGVVFRNDGSQFDLGRTNAGDPWGYVAAWLFDFDLASGHLGIAWGPDPNYWLTVPNMHTSVIAADSTITAGGRVTVGGGITVSGGRSSFNSGDPYPIGLQYGSAVTYIGTTSSGQFQLSNSGGGWMLISDSSGNVITGGALTVNGLIHSQGQSGGIMFPDGTIQTTAVGAAGPPSGNFPGNVSVGGTLTVSGTTSLNSALTVSGNTTVSGVTTLNGQCVFAAPSGSSLGIVGNGEFTFVAVSNTEMIIVLRGYDGLTRQSILNFS